MSQTKFVPKKKQTNSSPKKIITVVKSPVKSGELQAKIERKFGKDVEKANMLEIRKYLVSKGYKGLSQLLAS